MSSPSVYEIEDTQIILHYLFSGNAKNWKVSDRMIDELGKALSKLKTCNIVFDLLPRPGFVDKDYFRRQLRGIARRIKSGTGDYNLCKTAINYGQRRHFEIIGTVG
ncbi:hypothetical protein MNBD_GAMMA21-1504 [hydrothermal vent metagenome]|uniref:Uncharacterized protein n=1 Tax=hydrothermal vent metagenome TaxID=652676 RepID=A0A3B1ABM5_9ZZZZ